MESLSTRQSPCISRSHPVDLTWGQESTGEEKYGCCGKKWKESVQFPKNINNWKFMHCTVLKHSTTKAKSTNSMQYLSEWLPKVMKFLTIKIHFVGYHYWIKVSLLLFLVVEFDYLYSLLIEWTLNKSMNEIFCVCNYFSRLNI